MSTLCGWLATLVFIVGAVYAFEKDNLEYVVEFMLGAMFTLAVWAAITL